MTYSRRKNYLFLIQHANTTNLFLKFCQKNFFKRNINFSLCNGGVEISKIYVYLILIMTLSFPYIFFRIMDELKIKAYLFFAINSQRESQDNIVCFQI